ncbi:ROK family protein [Agromyces sp. NBRC 114283]|uniref:ROK family protein n=1 Tax=Agromyces sp. NBRC 114283 TaxID=2994521 RepID=UPI0024A5BA02|nr:ROK family protein [Agromyces sp. NBRC 114283]GLU88559.1 xylose repressor protein [Agromyces sp. NBRC 114283]
MKLRTGSKALIREINESLVLDVVRAEGPVARGVIAARTGLSAATITGITAQLLGAGLLQETDVVRRTGGRPARLLQLGVDAVFAVGARVSAGEVVLALVDLGGAIVATERIPLDSTAPGDVLDAVASGVERLSGARSAGELIGVGVAVSGMVDSEHGVVRHSGTLGWEGVRLGPLLAERLGLPVRVDSYVNSVAAGALLLDARLEGESLLVFSVGASLGASVVVDGRVQQGHAGAAGGFAHWRIGTGAEPGRPCHCGAVDCLETRASAWGIARELERRRSDEPGAGRDGEAALEAAVAAEAAAALGQSMANACKLFGPDRVILAFAPEADRERLAEATVAVFGEQFAHEHAPAPLVEITTAEPIDLSRGAAYVLLSQLFNAEYAIAA